MLAHIITAVNVDEVEEVVRFVRHVDGRISWRLNPLEQAPVYVCGTLADLTTFAHKLLHAVKVEEDWQEEHQEQPT